MVGGRRGGLLGVFPEQARAGLKGLRVNGPSLLQPTPRPARLRGRPPSRVGPVPDRLPPGKLALSGWEGPASVPWQFCVDSDFTSSRRVMKLIDDDDDDDSDGDDENDDNEQW